MLSNSIKHEYFSHLKYNPAIGGTSLPAIELLSTSVVRVCFIMLNQIRFWYKDKQITAFVCDKYPGYSLTEDGRVFSHRKGLPSLKHQRISHINYKEGRPRKIQKNPKGYPIVSLSFWGKSISIALHSWMAYLFYGEIPAGLQVRHLDGNVLNYHYKNLQYGTPLENAADRMAHGNYFKGEKHCNSKLSNDQATEIRKLRLEKVSIKDLANMFNISTGTVQDVLADKSYKCGHRTLIRNSPNYKRKYHEPTPQKPAK